MADSSKPSLPPLLVVPVLITLAVTLLRLFGELARWSPSFFNRDAGGPGALVGIVWLIPVFGIVFANEMYNGLRSLGVDTQLVVFPREGHGMSEVAHQLDFQRRVVDWYRKHIRPATSE